MAETSVAYLVKGWPRQSELFIASEIRRLESLGVPIRLFVVKAADEATQHAVVDEIRVRPVRLPATTSLSSARFASWLWTNLPAFVPATGRMLRRHPVRVARAVGAAGAQSVRARRGWAPRKVYVKELLHAIAFADEIELAGDVSHLHAHFAHGATTITWLAARMTGKPFSFTGHAKDIYRESLNPAGLLARKLRDAAFTVTCTAANVEHLRRVEPDSRVNLVYHGLNSDFSHLLRAAPPRVAPVIPRIVSVGRFVAKKGFDILLDAVDEIRRRGLDVEVVIIGETGDQEPVIRARVAELRLGEIVELRGPATQPELLAEFRRASVFALACRIDADGDRDGIPNVLVEAMAAGLPVVSTAVSGIPELVRSGDNGLLVRPDSATELADALERLLEDADLGARLAEQARCTVRRAFDGDVCARQLADLFSRAQL